MAVCLFQFRRIFWLPLAAIVLVLQLAGCGNNEPQQRKAFIDFLQNTVMRSNGQLPTLSEDQKQRFGHYASDYALLYQFSQQMKQTINDGLKPVVDTLSAIHVPQDYLTQRDALRQSAGSLNVLAQQLSANKTQAENRKNTLTQSDDVKAAYSAVWDKTITQPTATLSSLLPVLQSLSQEVIQAGDFLQQQGTQVTFNDNGVQFPMETQVAQYNAIMSSLSAKADALKQAQLLLQQTQ